jgi:predicted YcjX-like family ATPase
LKEDGKHSTLSDDREQLLTKVGFIWGSHSATWQEHFQNLHEFHLQNGHFVVPLDYEADPSLSVWCKHQRRQYKCWTQGRTSTMTQERYQALQSLGFNWNPRKK